jgi:hypothetical protein
MASPYAAKPATAATVNGLQRASDPGDRRPSSHASIPTQVLWTYDGCDLCGRVEVINNIFIAIDADEKIVGRFKTLRQATRALPARGAP